MCIISFGFFVQYVVINELIDHYFYVFVKKALEKSLFKCYNSNNQKRKGLKT